MSELILPLTASISTLRLISSDGGEATVPTLRLGDTMRCELRLYDTAEGDQREVWPNVRTLNAAFGRVCAPPDRGEVWLKLGDDGAAFGPITRAATGEELKALLNTAELGVTCAEVETEKDKDNNLIAGLWLLRFDSDEPLTLKTAVNKLRPESFARWREFRIGDVWWHELRLIQAPLAFNEDGHARMLPPAPYVRQVRPGGDPLNLSESDVNEIQALVVPRGFVGTFVLRWNGRETKILGIQDGPDELAAALNGIWTDGKKRFVVTNPEQDQAYIEFIGPLADAGQPLIEVSVKSFQPGALTFTLSLDRAQMHAALRAVAEIEVPLEIELEVVGDDEDAADPAVPGRIITIAQQTVKIAREQIWKQLATIQAIDWLRPPEPRNYIPFTLDQVLIGNQATYVAVLGDGELRSISLPHNLGTANGTIAIRENAENGRLLVLGTDYQIRFPSENEIVVEFPAELDPPAFNAFVFNFTASGPASAFMAGLHITIPQVDGLEDALNMLSERLSTVEELLPTVTPSLTQREQEKGSTITLPDRREILPGAFPSNFNFAEAATKGTGLRAAPILLPAIHDAEIADAIIPLPSAADNTGDVFVNHSGAPIILPGVAGQRSTIVPVDGHLGSDGRAWYRLTRAGGTNSFYPADYERELFVLPINASMLRAGQSLTIEFDLALALLKATTKTQMLLRIEAGSVPAQNAPTPTGENIEDVVWLDTPLLSQRLVLSPLSVKHHFGCFISRDAEGAFAANRLLYGRWEAAAVVPPDPTFVVRARLIQFDTENSVTNARGFVFYEFTKAEVRIS